MRKRMAMVLLAAWCPVYAQETAPRVMSEAELAEGAARVVMFVPPDYPPAALRENVEATVDVVGTVRPDGRLEVARMEASVERAEFRKAIEEVAKFWLFRPSYDRQCRPREVEGRLRIWFEIKEGKPAISISVPRVDRAAVEARSPIERGTIKVVHRVEPRFPREAQNRGMTGAVEALMRVAPSGVVEEVVIVPGVHAKVFGPAVAEALSQWRYAPRDGPVGCYQSEIVFNLNDRPASRNIRANQGNAPGADGR